MVAWVRSFLGTGAVAAPGAFPVFGVHTTLDLLFQTSFF
jgi:hypothetical protein